MSKSERLMSTKDFQLVSVWYLESETRPLTLDNCNMEGIEKIENDLTAG